MAMTETAEIQALRARVKRLEHELAELRKSVQRDREITIVHSQMNRENAWRYRD